MDWVWHVSHWVSWVFHCLTCHLKRDRKKLRPPLRLMGFLPVKNHVFLWSFILTKLCKVILSLRKRWLFSWNTLALPEPVLTWIFNRHWFRRAVCGKLRFARELLAVAGPLRQMCRLHTAAQNNETKCWWRWHIELWASWSLIRHKRWMLVHIFTFQIQFACLQWITHRKPISPSKGLCRRSRLALT